MWVNRQLFDMILKDNKAQQNEILDLRSFNRDMVTKAEMLVAQKAKDDQHIDWMRHRINALEKEKAALIQKELGITLAVPEIMTVRPGTVGGAPDFSHIPSFEDVGEDEAKRLGIDVDADGRLFYKQ
jgi:hypothetical protein